MNKLPLVALSRGSYLHPKGYGKIAVPLFEIIGRNERPPDLKPILPPISSNALLVDHSDKLIEHKDSENPGDDMDDLLG